MSRSDALRADGVRGGSPAEGPHPPLYVRALRLRHLRPSGPLCFLYFEGALALGGLLALAEIIPWWGVPASPAAVAAMVKLNDVIAGGRCPPAARPRRLRPLPGGSPGRRR